MQILLVFLMLFSFYGCSNNVDSDPIISLTPEQEKEWNETRVAVYNIFNDWANQETKDWEKLKKIEEITPEEIKPK